MSEDRTRRRPIEADLSPADFEREVHHLIRAWIDEYPGSEVEHDALLECADGDYQMDVVIRLSLPPPTGILVILVDAKRRTRVERRDLQALHAKVQSCGGHKGVIVATGSFQSGALEYGRAHGIGMVQFIDRSVREFRDRREWETPVSVVPALVEPAEKGVRFFTPEEPSEILEELLDGHSVRRNRSEPR